jgi:hypothetical protein
MLHVLVLAMFLHTLMYTRRYNGESVVINDFYTHNKGWKRSWEAAAQLLSEVAEFSSYSMLCPSAIVAITLVFREGPTFYKSPLFCAQ